MNKIISRDDGDQAEIFRNSLVTKQIVDAYQILQPAIAGRQLCGVTFTTEASSGC